ncbi:MAG: hypothetical protein M0Q91_08815 [Methanoregula sp.]|jgi:hypothetical protein|nr:hypothetical protein [Methanoregula sp.]
MTRKLPTVSPTQEITQVVTDSSRGFTNYLTKLNLPSSNVLVEVKERGRIIAILPDILENLTPEQKERAFYLSKFTASCGVGLFDAALNYLWNETIENLRFKVINFDLEYFFENAIPDPKKRITFNTAEDLKDLSDSELIEGCLKTEIISDIGYSHLNYIREMRNFASAAHPNQKQISGIQLAGWLETCIREVLSQEPSKPAFAVKRLIHSIKTQTLTEEDAKPIIMAIDTFPQPLINSILQSLFGMYTTEEQSADVRKNIEYLANGVWKKSDSSARNNIGLKYGSYSITGSIERKRLGNNFLKIVNGLSYLSVDQLAIEMKNTIDQLFTTHTEMNNFYNEEPLAKTLLLYVPRNKSVPDSIRKEYVKILTICRLGNQFGVAFTAKSYYNEMFGLFQDPEKTEFLRLLNDRDILQILDDETRAGRYQEIARSLIENTKSESIKKVLKFTSECPIIDFKSGGLGSTKIYQSIKEVIK